MNKKAKLGIAIALILVIAVVVSVAARNSGGDAVQVRMQAISQLDLTASVSASGWIRPNRKVDVQSDIMGRIIALAVDEGDRVVKGQILLRIDPAQYEAAVARARAAVKEAEAREAQTKANLLQADRAYKRFKEL